MANHRVSRRAVLGGIAGTASALTLVGCSSSEGGSGDFSEPGKAQPPTYVPFEDVTPDLPGDELGVSPAFFKFPAEPVQREGFPLPQTDPVTGLLQGVPPQVAPDKNDAYKNFREQAGNTMEATTVTSADYMDKLQVTLAGGDIPDFVQLSAVPQFPALLEKHFTDLSDVLAGDNITKYAGLANIPPPTWDIPKINGRIWGIAQPRPPAGRILSTRGDILEEAGVDPNPEISSGEDFVALLAELTNKGEKRFSMGADPTAWLLPGLLEMMGAPNMWSVEDGKFVSQIASEQMLEALNEGAKIIKGGYLHPNSFSDPAQNANWWTGGVTAMYFQAFTGWGTFARSYPDWNVGYVRLPNWDGSGTANVHKGPAGYAAFVGIKKQESDERLEELLRIADLIASPFGTQQFLDVNYGTEGFTFEMEDGNPVYLPDAASRNVVGWQYMGGNSQAVLFAPGQDEMIKAQHAYLTEVLPDGIEDASLGLYSETQLTDGATWTTEIADLKRAIMTGEKPVSDWSVLVKEWQADVGDQIAAEYEESAAAS